MEVKVTLDTNRYTDLARGESTVMALVTNASMVVISFMVLAELRAGFSAGSKTSANTKILDIFLAKPTVKVVYPDEQTVQQYATLYQQLKSTGKMIPIADLWIAAITLQHDLALCTRDSHFDSLPQLKRA